MIPNPTRITSTWLIALSILLVAHAATAQPSPHFVPDWAFSGSDLSAWRPLGGAQWKAEAGAITGTPNGAGGWLISDQAFHDFQFSLRFRCAAACNAGVLLRAKTPAEGGPSGGMFIAVTDSLRLYQVSLDAAGRELVRTPLPAAGAMRRIAPAVSEGPLRMASAMPLAAGDWNTLHIAVDANIVRVHEDGWEAGTAGVTGEHSNGYGSIALYVGGSGAVEFDGLSAADMNLRRVSPETTSPLFSLQRLDEFYYAWDTAVADINRDGVSDVVAGPYYYLGPDYTQRGEIYAGETFSPSTDYTPNMVTHAHDFTGDGWPDVLATESRPMVLYVNPQGENRRWDPFLVLPGIVSETTLLRDMDGDGQPEVVMALAQGILAYGEPNPADPTAPWTIHRVSEPIGNRFVIHGLGAGDVNGDGRADILIASGWFEQPPAGTLPGNWLFHPFPFNEAGGIVGHGGGTMSVVDLNGDGRNDVATSLSAHGWGLAWFEQTRDASGGVSFTPHLIMGDFSTDNAGGVVFSQLHAGVEIADLDADGVPDLVTGKRYWSHLDSSTDPDPYGEAVTYGYRTVRQAQAPGGISFEPELIHNRSGVGSQFEVLDLNADGAVDIVTSGDRGTFIIWGTRR
ncbi:MAG: family 16 glycoside hydrolase [Rhodothermales bacterium]|nr:family 16 glycoside hydrolase [Rhodothermales bacterium]